MAFPGPGAWTSSALFYFITSLAVMGLEEAGPWRCWGSALPQSHTTKPGLLFWLWYYIKFIFSEIHTAWRELDEFFHVFVYFQIAQWAAMRKILIVPGLGVWCSHDIMKSREWNFKEQCDPLSCPRSTKHKRLSLAAFPDTGYEELSTSGPFRDPSPKGVSLGFKSFPLLILSFFSPAPQILNLIKWLFRKYLDNLMVKCGAS